MSGPTISELSAQIDDLKAVIGYLNRSLSELRYENDVDAENLNIAWILITGCFIFFMQAGFTLVEVGGVRLLNSTVVLLKKAVTICIGAVAFWLVGFGFAFGTGNPFIGTTYFALYGIEDSTTVSYTTWFFQWTFSLTSSTIVSGSLLERTRLRAYLVCTFISSAWIYPVVAHWIWATDGWLTANKPVSDLFYANGVLDFAGCGVVHMVGGIIALVGAIVVGARMERFEPKRKNEFAPNNSAFMTLGTFILWFSWYGFNSGSILRLNQGGSAIASKVVLNTSLSAAIAGCVSLFQARLIMKEYNLPVTLNGILTGLVSITAGCAFVQPWSAIVIGIIGSVIHFWGAKLLIKLKIDDPLEASVVHFFGGSWGLIATGLFAVSDKIEAVYLRPAVGGGGLFTEGTGYQLAMQLLAFAVILGWTTFWACILFIVLRALDSLRISSAAERTMLLDIHQAGVAAMNPLTTPVNRNRPDVVVFDDESEVVLEPSTNHTRSTRRNRESRDTSRPSQSIERSVESSSDTPSSSDSEESEEGTRGTAMAVFEPTRNYVMERQVRHNSGRNVSNNNNQPAPVVVEVPDSSDSTDETPVNNNNNMNIIDPEDDPIIDPMLLHQRMSLDNMQRTEPSPPHSSVPSDEWSASEDSSSEANRHIAMIRDGTSNYNTILNHKRNKKQKKT